MSGPELLYVNVSSAPGAVSNEARGPAVLYTDARSTPIVGKANDYRASVIRFQCQGLDLPAFIPPMKNDGTDETQLEIAITAFTGATSDSVHTVRRTIRWVSEEHGKDLTAPYTPEDTYYWSRTIEHFLGRCVQPAFDGAFRELLDISSISTLTDTLVTDQSPRIVYKDNKFSLHVTRGYTKSAGTAGPTDPRFVITWNQAFETFFGGFPTAKYFQTALPQGSFTALPYYLNLRPGLEVAHTTDQWIYGNQASNYADWTSYPGVDPARPASSPLVSALVHSVTYRSTSATGAITFNVFLKQATFTGVPIGARCCFKGVKLASSAPLLGKAWARLMDGRQWTYNGPSPATPPANTTGIMVTIDFAETDND